MPIGSNRGLSRTRNATIPLAVHSAADITAVPEAVENNNKKMKEDRPIDRRGENPTATTPAVFLVRFFLVNQTKLIKI